MIVRDLVAADWPAVAAIYAEGIGTGDATFETEVPTWETWNESRDPRCRIVAERDGVVVGFAAVSPVSKRPAYAGVREVMVYVAAHARGAGIGGTLMRDLVARTEAAGIWTLQASIFPENVASIRAHEREGFRAVGRRERIGRRDGRWRDTVIVERRSASVGLD
jgi:phosphinothricin acetyltransferase